MHAPLSFVPKGAASIPLSPRAERGHLHHLRKDVSQTIQAYTGEPSLSLPRYVIERAPDFQQRNLPPISYIWYLRAIACRPYILLPVRMHVATATK